MSLHQYTPCTLYVLSLLSRCTVRSFSVLSILSVLSACSLFLLSVLSSYFLSPLLVTLCTSVLTMGEPIEPGEMLPAAALSMPLPGAAAAVPRPPNGGMTKPNSASPSAPLVASDGEPVP